MIQNFHLSSQADEIVHPDPVAFCRGDLTLLPIWFVLDDSRLDDVVIVEGEWGCIEEITTTFVVVRIWDQRRLIVPLTYFIEKPFQNWTRRSSDIVGHGVSACRLHGARG